MDIRRLEAFCKVFELGSFSKAGQELFLSQPTISAHVSSLEDELGVQLFDRLGRMILPTQAGEILYLHARDVFTSLEAARSDIQLLRDKVTGDLVIGASSIPSTYLLPRHLAEFSRRYPEVKLGLRCGDSSQIVDMVAAGDLLLGIVGASQENSDLRFTPICDDELVVVAAAGFKSEHAAMFFQNDPLTWPWVMRERGSGTRRTFESAVLEWGRDPRTLRVVMSVESTETAIMCVMGGMGVTVTSRLAAESGIASGELEIVAVPGLSMKRRFYLVHHEKRSLFPVTRYFIDFLVKACRKGEAEAVEAPTVQDEAIVSGVA